MAEWKKIGFHTDVLEVPTGMVIRTYADDAATDNEVAVALAMVFVPRSCGQIYLTDEDIRRWIAANEVKE